MSYIETLRKSKEKHTVAFEEFMLSTRRFSNYLFCFFEGKDNAYYVPRIKRFTDGYCPINCGGRESVLAVHRLIAGRKEYQPYKKAFFIDKDFNKPLSPQHPPIFETPCYSIENLYVSTPVFKEILINKFQLSNATDAFVLDKCIECFTDRQNEFHEAVRLFNAWYACLITIRNEKGEKAKAKLEDKLEKGFVEITLQYVKAHYDLEQIKVKYPEAPAILEADLNQKIIEFSRSDVSKVFRGKYELEFLIKFIQLILNDSVKTQSIVKNKIKFAFGDASSLNNEQALTIFSDCAETPDSLIFYLKQIIL
jgi:Protein of unknown function (DUF4435)